jgi:hypothetical protein
MSCPATVSNHQSPVIHTFIVSIRNEKNDQGIASQETCHLTLNSQLSGEKRELYNA